jgi:hypothetical protein
LPDGKDAYKKVLEIARKVKLARALGKYSCPKGNGCRNCKPMEKILKGETEFVGNDEYNADVYILNEVQEESSIVL